MQSLAIHTKAYVAMPTPASQAHQHLAVILPWARYSGLNVGITRESR